MRTARRASNVEVPSFLRQLVKETEKMVTFFFKGGPSERVPGEEENLNEDDTMPSPYLERPILEKHVSEGGSQLGLNYAVASMQGWRAHMEDAHTCMPQLKGELEDWAYFAVFDGHAGITVAQYCSRNLLDHILTTGGIKANEDPEQVKEGIREGFLDIDRHMHKMARQDTWDRSGSTAAAVMISPHHIYFINCGDSRTLLCNDGQVIFYTEDHKPFNPREKERIQNAGGSVTLQRINGSLAVSRALGDFDFKEEALQQEAELEQHIDMKVEEIIQRMRSKAENPDLLYVIKFLAEEEMPGLPPGGGITSKRDCIISAYQKHISALRTHEPMDIGGSEEDSN
uniref:Protein phosphatase, Mg2+/Mn2+ dependent, 1Na (Putative) n=1 Tax=Nothobranchius kuhntae TaxID=321403 RepID=A0A1A8IB31_NOTKU